MGAGVECNKYSNYTIYHSQKHSAILRSFGVFKCCFTQSLQCKDPQLHFKLSLKWKMVVAKSAWVKPWIPNPKSCYQIGDYVVKYNNS